MRRIAVAFMTVVVLGLSAPAVAREGSVGNRRHLNRGSGISSILQVTPQGCSIAVRAISPSSVIGIMTAMGHLACTGGLMGPSTYATRTGHRQHQVLIWQPR